ncbi:MAG: hypothetical protein WAN97_11775, partial [Candidatus Acidiferrales bacterium]
PLGRISSKLDFFLPGIRNQPHLCDSVGKSGPSADSLTNQGTANIRRVYQDFGIRQVYVNDLLG